MKKVRPFIDAKGHIFERTVEGMPHEFPIDKLVHTLSSKVVSLEEAANKSNVVEKEIYQALNPAFKYGNKVSSLLVYISEDFMTSSESVEYFSKAERAKLIHDFIMTNSPFLFSYADRFTLSPEEYKKEFL